MMSSCSRGIVTTSYVLRKTERVYADGQIISFAFTTSCVRLRTICHWYDCVLRQTMFCTRLGISAVIAERTEEF